MNRRKGISSVDDSNGEEINRRKMRDKKQRLKILERDFTGPNYRKGDCCHLSKAVNMKELQEELPEKDEDTDVFDLSSIQTKVDFKLGLHSRNSPRLTRLFSQDTRETNVHQPISADGGREFKPVLTPPVDTDSKTMEDIDEALWIAVCNLGHLKDADEMLKYLELKVKQEGDKVAEIADRIFDELITSLQSRKRKLYAELLMNIDSYSAEVAKAKQYIEEKKNCLIGAVRIAKELKITPSVRSYCDLAQIIHNLKLTVEDELSRVNSLKEKTSLSLFVNTDEITALLKNMGKIEWGKTTRCFPKYSEDGAQHTLRSDDKEEMPPGCDTHLSFDNAFPALTRERKIKTSGKLDGEMKNTRVQELLTMIHRQNIPVLPKTLSSPDVIIEEIIEDDEEEFLTEFPEDEQRKKLFKMETPLEYKPGSAELVFVSHVINPCHFYIRRYSQKKVAVVLEKKLKTFCRSLSSYLSPSDVLEIDTQAHGGLVYYGNKYIKLTRNISSRKVTASQLYRHCETKLERKLTLVIKKGGRTFIKSKETGVWCRGTITELIPLKRKNARKPGDPVRYRVCDIAVMEVFLIDFGSSEVIIFSSNKYIPVELPETSALQIIDIDDICLFIRKPDEHIEAQLADIPPLAVLCSLKDIVPKNASEGWGQEAKTEFLKMVNNKVVLMSIFREEDGVLIVDLKKPPFNKISNNMPVSLKDALVFLDLARFRSQLPSELENNIILQYSPPKLPQESEEVSVVVCHVNSPSDFYLQLMDSLDFLALPKKIEEIYKHENRENLEIVYPAEGQACIAKYKDEMWCRAEIIGLPSHQEVVVKYVDFGSVAKISLKDVCKVKKEFLSFPEKAIRSKLAHIEPYKGASEWTREAKERFEEMTEDKFMLCSVVKVLENNILCVELFDSSAVPGRCSSINLQLVKEDLASYIPGYIGTTTVGPNEIWDAPLDEIPETLENSSPVNMEHLEEVDVKALSKKELQVRISHVVSPSKIFIQWPSSESLLKSLQEEMATIYEESQPEHVQWEPGMYCAVYVRDCKLWQRGQITRIASETTAEVTLYDSGAVKTVDISCLRKLEENMKIMKTLAIECSLVDIRPTGGSRQWTATVCECVSYYLTGAQAKIIIQESAVAHPLPVKILCKDEAGQFIDISEHLIKKGLAFRNRRTESADSAGLIPKEHPEVDLEPETLELDSRNSEAACALDSAAPEKDITVSERERKSTTAEEPLPSALDEVYKPPVIPEAKIFRAVVSCIGHDGTIYVIPVSLANKLSKLMSEIQCNFKCLGLLEPYCWKKGEACVIRGSDTMWYRGKVTELGGGTLQVQYIDRGSIEKIPQCHLYPTDLYTDVPPFCIPCELYKTVPIGNFWQQDAVDVLQELLTDEEVEIHVQELPADPRGKLSISLYIDGMSVSSLMAYQKYCLVEGCQDMSKLELPEGDVPSLPVYTLPSLPVPGDIFPVRVTHLVSPKEMYICLDPSESPKERSAAEAAARSEPAAESLEEALKWCNKNVDSLPPLTNFRTEMPCLVEYNDGLWYRAKLLAVKELDPVKVLIQFVDYGNFSVVPASRLRQIPSHVLHYPAQAVRALLAGFRPPASDHTRKRIPYCPEWSMEALWAMMECVEGKQLSASIVTVTPEVTISLYEDDQNLVHMKLIEMGFADLDE